MALLVLDDQLSGRTLVAGLRSRGLEVATAADFGASAATDAGLTRAIAERHEGPWVLVTMDAVKAGRGGHATAWIVPAEDLAGAELERAKANVLHRWAHEIASLRPGDRRSYYETLRTTAPPSPTRTV